MKLDHKIFIRPLILIQCFCNMLLTGIGIQYFWEHETWFNSLLGWTIAVLLNCALCIFGLIIINYHRKSRQLIFISAYLLVGVITLVFSFNTFLSYLMEKKIYISDLSHLVNELYAVKTQASNVIKQSTDESSYKLELDSLETIISTINQYDHSNSRVILLEKLKAQQAQLLDDITSEKKRGVYYIHAFDSIYASVVERVKPHYLTSREAYRKALLFTMISYTSIFTICQQYADLFTFKPLAISYDPQKPHFGIASLFRFISHEGIINNNHILIVFEALLFGLIFIIPLLLFSLTTTVWLATPETTANKSPVKTFRRVPPASSSNEALSQIKPKQQDKAIDA